MSFPSDRTQKLSCAPRPAETKTRGRCFWLALLVLLGGFVLPCAAQNDASAQLAEAESYLEANGVGTDVPALLAFFHQETLTTDEEKNLGLLMPQLGAKSYRDRELATAQLIAAGPKGLPVLRQGLGKANLEGHTRALHCIRVIESRAKPQLYLAAARLLHHHNPPQTGAVLFAYLPYALNETVHESVLITLWNLALDQGKITPLLVQGLADPEPIRRAAAALIVSQIGNLEQRQHIAKMLADADARVRLAAAQGLLAAKEKSAVPALLALLREGPTDLAVRAEELLHLAAGESAPPIDLARDAGNRHQCFKAWQAWWQAAPPHLDWTQMENSLPWKDQSSHAQLVAMQFMKALVTADLSALERTTDVPFTIGNGLVAFKNRQQLMSLLGEAGQDLKQSKATAKVLSVQLAQMYLKQARPDQAGFLKKLELSKLFVATVEIRQPTRMETGALLLCRSNGQLKVIAVLENN